MMLKISDEALRRKVTTWVLDTIYPVPGEAACTDYAFNTDVFDMTWEEQCEARERIRFRLLFDPAPSPWLLARYRALADMEGGLA